MERNPKKGWLSRWLTRRVLAMCPVRAGLILAALASVCACASTASQPPLSINSPRLDSGIRGSAGDGLGGEAVVGKPEGGAGVVNRIRVP